jgi:putative two-component system hydrogenase maturation factor HypX/HoxX
MGLHGSEYWTYVLPRRVGTREAAALTSGCLPIGAAHAERSGLADEVRAGRPAEFEQAVLADAHRLAARSDYARLLERKVAARAADESRKPLEAYRIEELGEMSRDIFDDRNGFSDARSAFVTKRKPTGTPARLARQHPAATPAPQHRGVARVAS